MTDLRPRQTIALSVGLAACVAVAWLLLSGGGDVARAQSGGGTPVDVSPFGCMTVGGGQRFVPAGSEIVIRQGYASTAAGGVKSFIDAELTLISVNDGPMSDVSGEWAEVPVAVGSLARITHPTGVTLPNPGDAMRFTFALTSKRPLLDPSDYDGDGKIDPNLMGPGLLFGGTCTVTAF